MFSRKWWLLPLLVLLAGCRAGAAPEGDKDTPPASRPEGRLQVAFIDVGQGDSTLVLLPNGKSLLIDGGPSEAGPKVVETLQRGG